MPRRSALQTSYDRVAGEYAARFADELAQKPLDRALLACFAEQVRGRGPVADVGCGPGQIARHLQDLGLPVLGVDIAPGMVALAQRLHPDIAFVEGTMLALDLDDASCGGIVALYSIIHLPFADVPRALGEFHRVLRPDGLLLLGFHVGRETVHRDELWGLPVSLDFHFFEPSDIEAHLDTAGFVVEARLERHPYVAVEYPSRRAYLLARKPATAAER